MTAQVALTGATGFIGSGVLAGLRPAASVRALVRTPEALPGWESVDVVPGDLGDPDALRRLVDGADVLVHAASYVGSDTGLQAVVNVLGTQRAVAAAAEAGVERIVLLSTAGVYGGDLGPGRAEDGPAPAPRSSLSASRFEAEQLVLEAGGVVVRPHLVHGRGDRWFLSAALAAIRRVSGWIGDPDAPLSAMGRARLGAVVAHLALVPVEPGVYHAAEAEPTTMRRLVEPVLGQAGRPRPSRCVSVDEAAEALAPAGVARHQIELVARDSWFDTTKLWSAVARTASTVTLPGPRVPEDVAWYARLP